MAGHRLVAFDSEGEKRWSALEEGQTFSSMAVGPTGTIYIVADDRLIALGE